ACIFFCQARRRSSVSRSGEPRWYCASSTLRSSVRFASIKSRNSRRKAAGSGLSAKSIGALLPEARISVAAILLNRCKIGRGAAKGLQHEQGSDRGAGRALSARRLPVSVPSLVGGGTG